MSSASRSAPASPRPASRRYGGLSHEQRLQQRRQALVDAAVRVFGSIGFHSATVKSICAEAGVTDRYFYESFQDAEHLLREAYSQVAAELLGVLQRSAARAKGREGAIRACLAAYFRFLRRPDAARVLLIEVLGVSPAVDALYQSTNVAFARAIVMPWLQGVRIPVSRGDPQVLAVSLTGAVTSAAMLWLLSGYRQPASRMAASCREVLLGTLQRLGVALD